MFLINAQTQRLESFIGDTIPPYSILSHRWGAEEVDHQTFKGQDRGAALRGFAKIASACSKSLEQGIKYTWVDTCCIDKTSSAELTEAINSMYVWYQKAEVCFAFLDDIKQPEARWKCPDSTIMTSQWLKRGWTLQELLAPSRVEFYNREWAFIGTRGDLAVELSRATGIAGRYLNDNLSSESRRSLILRASVGERMSWAARRVTTRKEDEAYCLLGLFGVNMPLIYGEGSHAFLRLQEEILRYSFDPTLLAWGILDTGYPLAPQNLAEPCKRVAATNYIFAMEHPWSRSWREHGLSAAPSTVFLAPQPRNFLRCDELIAAEGWDLGWALTPGGLRVSFPISRWLTIEQQPYLVLPCFPRHDPSLLLAIPVLAIGDGPILRGKHRAVFVPRRKWYQWPTAEVVLATRREAVPVDTRLKGPQLRSDVWIRSVPKGFQVSDMPADLDVEEGRMFLEADQAWDVVTDSEQSAKLNFSLQPGYDCKLSLRVTRRPYVARPLSALYPGFMVFFRALSRRYHSEISITAPGSRLPPVKYSQWYGYVHRPGPDFVKTSNGGLISVEATEEDIVGRPLLVIDIRHGPSRLGHLCQLLRRGSLYSQYHDLQSVLLASSAAHRPLSQMVTVALRSLATDMYDAFRLYYWLAAPILMFLWGHALGRTPSDVIFFTCLASFGLEITRLFSIRPSSIASVATRVCACCSIWRHFENRYHGNTWYERPSRRRAWDSICGWGPVAVPVMFFLYSLLPVVSILAPRATPFVWQHRLVLTATATSLLLHLAPQVVTSPIVLWSCTIFVAKSSMVGGRMSRYM